MKKAYSFRIYPNKNQEVKLNRTLATCRKLYNDALEQRKRQIELNRLCAEFQVFPWGKPEWITYEDQQNALPSKKTPEQKEVFSQVLQDVLRRLDKGFKKFFRGAGFPRFKVRNQRKDFDHKTSRNLVNTYDRIVFEKLQIQNMMKNHHLAKSISDAGWYQLICLTKSKAEEAGKSVGQVNPNGTSQHGLYRIYAWGD